MTSHQQQARPVVKCVVWDLDDTLWQGVAVENREPGPGAAPQPAPDILALIDQLERRGIASSVASRNDPSMRDLLLSHPSLKGRFVYPQVGWEPKSEAVRRIARSLNLGLDSMAFVDDSPFERAEVSYMLPEVLVLSPEEMRSAIDRPYFNTGSTRESARRVEMYREEERRREAEGRFGGSRTEFLVSCEMRLLIGTATDADLERIHEMTLRTHQLNSTGRKYSLEELRARLHDPRWLVAAARLTDRFGGYGLIGVALVDTRPPWPQRVWLVELIMLSCRVEGRGIPAAMLLWIMDQARASGMEGMRAVYSQNERNLPIRLLFRQLGFSKVAGDSLVTVARDLREPLPPYPVWLEIVETDRREETHS